MTLAEWCDVYLETVQHQKPKRVERKTLVVRRIKSDWPTGSQIPVGKIKPTHISLWLGRYKFGPVSRNLHLACIKDILAAGVGDSVIAQSPAAKLKKVKLEKPIRRTPTFEQFQQIVQSIRGRNLTATMPMSRRILSQMHAEAIAIGPLVGFEHASVESFERFCGWRFLRRRRNNADQQEQREPK